MQGKPLVASATRRWALVRLSAVLLALGHLIERPVWAAASLPERAFVLDKTGLIAPSTRKYLDGVLRRIQEQTGVKVRVVCPPPGLQEDREAFKQFLRPINKDWGMDQSSIAILAEQRVSKKWGRTLPLLSIQPGNKIQERFQYRFTLDFILGVADAFGRPQYYEAKGTDIAIQEATENVVAALFGLVDNPSSRYFAPLPEGEVATILKRHGL